MLKAIKKGELRKELLQKRRSLSEQEWCERSDRLLANLESLLLFRQAKTTLAYFSVNREPNLNPLFESNNKRWGFPRCVGKTLSWNRWEPGEKLVPGRYGILEPDANAPTIIAEEVDLILVPGVACDYRGYRLGYGGGFYDRLLSESQWASIPTIGIIFDFAYLPELPIDEWDKKLDGVCTDKSGKREK